MKPPSTIIHLIMPALAPTPTLRLLSLFFPSVSNTSLKTSFAKWMDSKTKSHAYTLRAVIQIIANIVVMLRSDPLATPMYLHPSPRNPRPRRQSLDQSARQTSYLLTWTSSTSSQLETQPGSLSNNGRNIKTSYESPSWRRVLKDKRNA